MSDLRECVICGCQHLSGEINELQARVAELGRENETLKAALMETFEALSMVRSGEQR
jgi:hypothetical protein